MFSWFKKEHPLVEVIFQVSEGAVEVALLHLGATHRVVMRKSIETLPKQHTRKEAVQALISALLEHPEVRSLELSLKDAILRCILVEPLSVSAEREVSVKLKQQAKITKKILAKTLVQGIVVKNESLTLPSEYVVYGEHVRLVTLNGYETDNPVGRYAQEIVLRTVQYLTSLQLWQAVAGELEANFNREFIYAHSTVVVDITRASLVDALFTLPSVAQTLDSVLLKDNK